MQRKLLVLIGFLLLITMGCGKQDKPDPNEMITSFIEQWTNSAYAQMYGMITGEAQDHYSKNNFIERNEKIHKDLEIDDIKISAATLEKDDIKKAFDEGKTQVKLTINFTTLAGPVQFNRMADLQLYENDELTEWKVNWDEGFILPGLEDGGKVLVEKVRPRRGEILDRNKMPLALNDVAYEIGIVPSKMENESTEIQQIAHLLDMSVDKINKLLDASWVQPDYFVPIKIIPASATETLDQLLLISSVTSKETSGRMYPLGSAASHLTGYIGPITSEEMEQYPKGKYKENDLIGKQGLEKMYEDQLHGEEGINIVLQTESETGSKEKELIAEKPVKNGEHVQLSIDVNIQEKIFNAYDGKAGTAAAIQPKTGEVLALVSSPAFNPNELTYGITQGRWDSLLEDADKPLINRFQSTFAPGSTIKPLTAAIGLSNGTINFTDGVIIDGLTWGKKEWGNVKVTRVSTSDKPVTLEDALVRSDNIYFAMKAVDMGAKAFIKGMNAFGFDEKIPIAYPIQKSQISNDGKLDEVLLANTSYGQGQIEISPLHLALGYSVFLNKGNMIKPNFLEEDKTGEYWQKDLITEQEAAKINEYLRDVVVEMPSANDEDLPISGKTGTAELKLSLDSKGHENGWFVGYPTEDEDILIAMMIEKVENIGASSYVAGKVKDILKDIKK